MSALGYTRAGHVLVRPGRSVLLEDRYKNTKDFPYSVWLPPAPVPGNGLWVLRHAPTVETFLCRYTERRRLPRLMSTRINRNVEASASNVTARVYDPGVGLVGWLAIAVASGVVLAVFGLWRSSKHRGATPDVGPVSDGWLAEQRGRKDP